MLEHHIWNAIYLVVLIGRPKYNISHPTLIWVSQKPPNFTAVQLVYKEQYEGTGKVMVLCSPVVFGKDPDWLSFENKILCGNYTPEVVAYLPRLKEFGYVYNTKKPFVDIGIGIAIVVTTLGISGKTKTLNSFSSSYSNYFYILRWVRVQCHMALILMFKMN